MERATECTGGCQYAKDVSMPEHECADECQYLAHEQLAPCTECDGSGISGEFEVDEAPATWDDPGYHEVREVPCHRCGGTGRDPQPQTLLQRLDQLNAMMRHPVNDETPF